MPNPFPGMDPYLEGQVWPGFHLLFLSELGAELVPRLRPNYFIHLEERVYVDHPTNGHAPRVVKPDVTLTRSVQASSSVAVKGATRSGTSVIVPLLMPERVHDAYLEIRRTPDREIVTVIELLSPANKRSSSTGRQEYLAKRDELLLTSVNLVEIDLLRGGERVPLAQPLPRADYYALISRGGSRPDCEVWPFSLREPLGEVPIPLSGSDPDVVINLQELVNIVHQRAGFDYSVDYSLAVTPAVPEDEAEWCSARVRAEGSEDLSSRLRSSPPPER